MGEYVIDWGPVIGWIHLAKDGESLIVLLGGGTKRRQQADIDRALALHVEYKAQKAPASDRNKAKKRKR
jgi:putative component of toxin-antitoxin plasmid stabilization module